MYLGWFFINYTDRTTLIAILFIQYMLFISENTFQTLDVLLLLLFCTYEVLLCTLYNTVNTNFVPLEFSARYTTSCQNKRIIIINRTRFVFFLFPVQFTRTHLKRRHPAGGIEYLQRRGAIAPGERVPVTNPNVAVVPAVSPRVRPLRGFMFVWSDNTTGHSPACIQTTIIFTNDIIIRLLRRRTGMPAGTQPPPPHIIITVNYYIIIFIFFIHINPRRKYHQNDL